MSGKVKEICVIAAAFAVLMNGCAAVPVAPLIPAALPAVLAGAGGGISYTLTNIAYRTITSPMEEVERATLEASRWMALKVIRREREHNKIELTAVTRVHTIYITLERLTPTLTRMSVNAKRGFVFKDKNTAFEIIYQSEIALMGFARGNEYQAQPGSARPPS
ncbi:DUF3568 family protein [bacterium]|nr:DUF3568 family protein [bacterium]